MLFGAGETVQLHVLHVVLLSEPLAHTTYELRSKCYLW